MPSVTVEPTHPVVFVGRADATDIPIPTPENLADAKREIAYVGTQSYVDGPVTLELLEESVPTNLAPGHFVAWSGVLEHDGVVSISDSGDEVFLQLDVQTDRSQVDIVVDDPMSPRIVTVYVSPVTK